MPTEMMNEPVTLGVIVMVVVAGMKLFDKLLELFGRLLPGKKKDDSPSSIVLKLDSEASKLLKETREDVKVIYSVIGRVDSDGTPMVYSSRTNIENIRNLVILMNDMTKSQERLAESLSSLDEKFSSHDRSDQLVFSKMADTLGRLENMFRDQDTKIQNISSKVHEG